MPTHVGEVPVPPSHDSMNEEPRDLARHLNNGSRALRATNVSIYHRVAACQDRGVTIPGWGCATHSFGVEEHRCELPRKIGHRTLLPNGRAADREAVIAACSIHSRERIAQAIHRKATHFELLRGGVDSRERLRRDRDLRWIRAFGIGAGLLMGAHWLVGNNNHQSRTR